MPVGQEWVTSGVFREAIKPRILMKHGVITPIEKPIL
jgi:U3 small nucleolar RNA-associated protein 14